MSHQLVDSESFSGSSSFLCLLPLDLGKPNSCRMHPGWGLVTVLFQTQRSEHPVPQDPRFSTLSSPATQCWLGSDLPGRLTSPYPWPTIITP